MSVSIGVDEAGRGPILGPMVLAAVAVDEAGAAELASAGVADSKAFGSGARAKQRRRALAAEIERRAVWVHTRVAHPGEIDARVERGELNHLEREMAAELLRRGPVAAADRIICDGKRLFSPLARESPGLVAEDRAEDAHLCVAAASIVAKNLRDVAFGGHRLEIRGRVRTAEGRRISERGYPCVHRVARGHVRATARGDPDEAGDGLAPPDQGSTEPPKPRHRPLADAYLPLPRRLLIHASIPASSFRARANADSANLS